MEAREKNMRLALVSLIALTAAATNAVAQPAPDAPAAPPAPAAAQPAPPPAAAPAAPAPAATPAPAPTGAPASGPAAPATPPPAAPAAAAPAPEAPAATDTEAPPPPPAPPTDPTAIGVLSVLTNICIPAANGGNLPQLAKTNGYRKTGDTWTLRQKDFTLVVESPGTNPNQCHVDITHSVDQDAPGKTIVVALHDWAQFTNNWSLYRNDKSVQGGSEYTTRSWQRDANGKSEGLAFITQRHPDGTPMQRTSDTSQLIYSQTKDAS
jgi:hypothetical protein